MLLAMLLRALMRQVARCDAAARCYAIIIVFAADMLLMIRILHYDTLICHADIDAIFISILFSPMPSSFLR